MLYIEFVMMNLSLSHIQGCAQVLKSGYMGVLNLVHHYLNIYAQTTFRIPCIVDTIVCV